MCEARRSFWFSGERASVLAHIAIDTEKKDTCEHTRRESSGEGVIAGRGRRYRTRWSSVSHRRRRHHAAASVDRVAVAYARDTVSMAYGWNIPAGAGHGAHRPSAAQVHAAPQSEPHERRLAPCGWWTHQLDGEDIMSKAMDPASFGCAGARNPAPEPVSDVHLRQHRVGPRTQAFGSHRSLNDRRALAAGRGLWEWVATASRSTQSSSPADRRSAEHRPRARNQSRGAAHGRALLGARSISTSRSKTRSPS